MNKTAIKVTNLSKRYRIGLKEELHDTFMGQIASFIKSPIENFKRLQKLSKFGNNSEQDDVIWALKDINFEVKHGEVLGIIGANGAGKSTLLKILAQITEPTTGRIEINGRIASLLEVGTGFHPELTGRENIYLNGTILGMTKLEIDNKFDEIVNFSEIEKFIDTPVKRYSSGMRVRLAFSVAAFLEPEILLIDEVLAVGDVEFQKKCLGKMGDIAGQGRTVLFVSHNMAAVNRLCDNVVVLHNGELIWKDSSQRSIEKYLAISSDNMKLSLVDREDRVGNNKVRMVAFSVVDSDLNKLDHVVSGQDIFLVIDYIVPSGSVVDKGVCIINFKTLLGQSLFSCSTRLYQDYLPPLKPKGKIICKIENLPLNEGSYYIDVLIKQGQDSRNILDFIEQVALLNVVAGDFFNTGRSANKQSSPMLVGHTWSNE